MTTILHVCYIVIVSLAT